MDQQLLSPTPLVRYFDWEKAKTFYFVAKCGSFAAAARFLNTSQPSLSRQIGYLEKHLGCPLFSRHSSGLKLTRKGEELLAIVEKTYAEFSTFTKSHKEKSSDGKKRKIRIVTTHAITSYILYEPIHSYNKEHPGILFELLADDYLVDIVLHDVDMAICATSMTTGSTPEQPGACEEPIFQLVKKLYASEEYIQKFGEPSSVEDLKNHHLIGHSHPEAHLFADVNWILKLGLPKGELHSPIFLSNSIECAIHAAMNGVGIVSSYDEYSLIRNSNLKQILPEATCAPLKSSLFYQENLADDPEVIALINFLKEYFQDIREAS